MEPIFRVRVSNPELTMQVQGETFAYMVSYLVAQNEGLKKAVELLRLENPHKLNERLALVENILRMLGPATAVSLDEHLRWAREQGLHFETQSPADTH